MLIHGLTQRYATMYANASKATRLKFVEERPMPLYEPFDEAEALRHSLAAEKFRQGKTACSYEQAVFFGCGGGI